MSASIETAEEAERFEERAALLIRAEQLGAVITSNTAAARRRARDVDRSLPLSAWTLAVKDNIHVADLPNTAGTSALRDFVPVEDAPVVRLLADAGAIVLAKANMHELAFGATSNNLAYGGVHNPVDITRSSGGSSGGTAALVAIGAARIGLGTDTGGSVRVPAAVTGTFGFRPTTGRYPEGGVTPLSSVRDTVGIIAACLDDILAVDVVLVPDPDPDPAPVVLDELVLGVPTNRLAIDLEPAVRDAWEWSLERLTAVGVRIAPIDIDEAIAADDESGMRIVLAEARRRLADYLREYATDLTIDQLVAGVSGPDVIATFDAMITDDDLASSIMDEGAADVLRARDSYARAFTTVDAVIFPTTPATARQLGAEDATFVLNGEEVDTFTTMIRNTSPGSFAGMPGISLPLRRHEGSLPVGFGLDGPRSGDRRLLSIAQALTAVLC